MRNNAYGFLVLFYLLLASPCSMAPFYKSDCTVCMYGHIYKLFRICQPIVLINCPHKDDKLSDIRVEISKFWSNLQLILVPIFLKALYNSYIKFVESTTEKEVLFNGGRVVLILCFSVNILFITSKSLRYNEIVILQRIINYINVRFLVKILKQKYLRNFRRKNRILMGLYIASFCVMLPYNTYKAYQSSEYAIWTIEFMLSFGSPSIVFFYWYLYYAANTINKSINAHIVRIMKLRLMYQYNSYNLTDKLKVYADCKKMIAKAILEIIKYREFAVFCVTIFLPLAYIVLLYLIIRYSKYSLMEEMLYRQSQVFGFLTCFAALCFQASKIAESVRYIWSNYIQ